MPLPEFLEKRSELPQTAYLNHNQPHSCANLSSPVTALIMAAKSASVNDFRLSMMISMKKRPYSAAWPQYRWPRFGRYFPVTIAHARTLSWRPSIDALTVRVLPRRGKAGSGFETFARFDYPVGRVLPPPQ